jgi:hypothetical protein
MKISNVELVKLAEYIMGEKALYNFDFKRELNNIDISRRIKDEKREISIDDVMGIIDNIKAACEK